MPGHPIHHIRHAAHDCAVRDMRAVHHDDGQAQFARRGDFGDSPFAARVFGNDDIDMLITQQRGIIGHCKGSAGDGDGRLWQGHVITRSIDKTQQVMVLGGADKSVQMLPPDGQKHPARGGAKDKRCTGKVWHVGPVISGCGHPWRTFKGDKGHACGPAGQNGIRAHLRGEGMCGVNDMGDAFAGKKGLQSGNTAKAADTGGQGLGHRGFGAASVGIDRIGVVLLQGAGQKAGLGRAAKQKDAHDV
ncbi:MAG: hypothetical protein RLZZ437_4 [Pseudomonadota bacterium]